MDPTLQASCALKAPKTEQLPTSKSSKAQCSVTTPPMAPAPSVWHLPEGAGGGFNCETSGDG